MSGAYLRRCLSCGNSICNCGRRGRCCRLQARNLASIHTHFQTKYNAMYIVLSQRYLQFWSVGVPQLVCNKFTNIVYLSLVEANDFMQLIANFGWWGIQIQLTLPQTRKHSLNVPGFETLPGRTCPVPYVFVADDAFALSTYMMKPYPGHKPGSSTSERIFNYRARRIIENVFGIMSSKFRILLKPIVLAPDKTELIVLVCIYLHNFFAQKQCIKK